MPKKKAEHSDWDLESQFDMAASLEELINEPPFKEVSGQAGDSKTVGVRIPWWLYRRVKKLKEVDGTPYELDSDILRDAAYLGLKVLNMRHKMNPDWDVESKMANIIDSATMAKRIKVQVKELCTGLEDLWKDGDRTKAAQALTNYINAAMELESDWYKRRLFGLLNDSNIIQIVSRACDKSVQDTLAREAT